jgi:TolA-binding protein
VLRRITAEYPTSIYVDDAIYELGVSLLTVPSYQDAAQAFNQIISKYPSSSYVVKSHLKLGLIYFNLDNDADALKQYQWVLTKYPKTADGAEALNGVKEIYTNKGDAQGYLDFVKGLPNVNVSDAVKDSVTYLAAESKYSKGDCSKAVNEFNSYLNNFPQGAFAMSAHFYRGECLFRQNDFDNALKDYEYVADQPQNRFSGKALLNAARINYSQKKNYDKAYNYYKQLSSNSDFKADALEAAKGMMYSAWYLNHFDDASNAANLILSLNNASSDDETEAHFYLGKIAYSANDLDKAFTEFSTVSKATSSVMGAESSYRIAEIYFKKDELKQAEDQSWDVIKKKPSSDYWIAKSYLLIADIYEAQGDYFQAKATLQSVLDNYKGNDDIIPHARKKMEEVKAKEAGNSKLQPDNTMQDEDSIQQENTQEKNQH